MATENHAQHIIECLKPLGVRKIILFGSRVWGQPGLDSDLDVLVILPGEEVPNNSAEKGELYRRVSTPLHKLQGELPLDIIVHTEGMHQLFLEKDSMFARQITQKGSVIYENGG